MAFYYLLLGHLIGDFVLQTDSIAQKKGRHMQWKLLHVFIVTFFILLFAYPFGAPVLGLIAVNGIIHFLFDHYKEKIAGRLRLPELAGFLLDQALHIMLLYFISFAASDEVLNAPLSESSNAVVYIIGPVTGNALVKPLIAFVLVTFFSAVLAQYVLMLLFPREGGRFFEKGEKYMGMLVRICVAVTFYFSFTQSRWYLLLLPVVAAALLIRYRLGWSEWMSPAHLAAKLFLDAALSVICVLFAI